MTEKEMRPTVVKWLEDQGLYVAHEVSVSGGWCDLVGVLWADRVGRRIPPIMLIMAVELKITDVAGVLYQARGNLENCDFSYAAMPAERCEKMRPATLRMFTDAGIGLLSVNSGVRTVIPPKCHPITEYHPLIARRIWDFKRRHGKEMG